MKNINKMKNLLNIFDADFWFGIEEKKMLKKTTNKKELKDKDLDKDLRLLKKELEISENNLTHVNFQDLKRKTLIVTDFQKNIPIDTVKLMPAGYIELYLENTNTDELFAKHNITLKYINIDNSTYIKSVLLVNDDRELDCYSLGENQSLTIKKENTSILRFIIKEKGGKVEEVTVVNGRVLS